MEAREIGDAEDGMTTDYPVDEALADAIRWAEAGAPYPPGARGWRPAIGVLAAEVQRLQALPQWKPIETAPRDGTTVLIHYTNCLGNGRTIKAKYLPRFYEESGCADGDGVDEYDEANDRYTYREGWWEVIENWGEFGFVKVYEGEPSHWMMMPIPPREAASA